MLKKKEETISNGANLEVAGVRELSDGELDSVIGGTWINLKGDGTFDIFYYKPLKNGLFQLIKESGFSDFRVGSRCETLRERGYTLKNDDLVYIRTENGVDLYGLPQ